MKGRAALLVAAVLTLSTPLVVGANALESAAPQRALADVDRPLAQRLVRMAAEHGGRGFATYAAQATGILDPLENTDPWMGIAIPDLDGDTRPDVLDLRWGRDHAPEFTLRLRSGTNGERRWTLASDRQLTIPLLIQLADGVPGLALFEVDYDAALTNIQYFISSYDATGVRQFEAELGDAEFGPLNLFRAEQVVEALLPGAGGPTELLLSLDTQAPGVGVGGVSTAAHIYQVRAMSLADGSVSDRGDLLTVLGFAPRVQVVGDMTGDDRPDFVVTHGSERTSEDNGVVVARDRDGTTLWSRDRLRIGSLSSAYSAGDATGDGLDDIVLSAFGSLGGNGLYLDPGGDAVPDPLGLFGFPGRAPRVVSLLESAEGELRWERPGLVYQWQTDVSGDGLNDPLVWDVRTVEGEYEAHVASVTGLGEAVYERVLGRIPVSEPSPETYGFAVFGVGDLEDDGVQDLLFRLYRFQGENDFEYVDGLADGRTAEIIRRDVGTPLGGSVDGAGDDLLTTDFDGKTGEGSVEIQDGATGAPLAAIDVPGPGIGFSYPQPVLLDDDDCSELLMNRYGTTESDLYALRVPVDEPLWALRRREKADEANPPHVSISSGLRCGDLAHAPAAPRPRPTTGRPGRTSPGAPLPVTGSSSPLTVVAGAVLLSLLGARLVATRRGA